MDAGRGARVLLDATPPFAAGQGWDYSDTNYIVLGMIMEGITGTKLYDEVQRRFLGPLKLTRVAADDEPAHSRADCRLRGTARSARPAGRGADERRVRHQSAVRVDGRRLRDQRARSRALGPRAVHGEGDFTAMRDLMIDEAVPARLGPETRYGLGVIVRPTTPPARRGGTAASSRDTRPSCMHVVEHGVTMALQVNTSAPRPPGTRSLLRAAYDLVAIIR